MKFTFPESNGEQSEIKRLIRKIGRHWVISKDRPKPKDKNLKHWNTLIEEWANNKSMPLFIRKNISSQKGKIIIHHTGRKIIPTDNTPAQWIYLMTFENNHATLKEISKLLKNQEIPTYMILSKSEQEKALYKCQFHKGGSLNDRGWKLCHIDPIGIRKNQPLEKIPINNLIQHFIKFMSPSNMFVIPKELGGLGELKEFTKKFYTPINLS